MYVYCVLLILRVNQFATVLFNVCSAVTVVLCFVPVLRGCVWYVSVMQGRRIFSSVLAITERRNMSLYEVPLPIFGFGMGTMLANFNMCGIILSSFKHACDECESKRAYVF